MENVLLIVHLIIALFLIGVVLLQRSEGGALGIGGGGGGLVSGRGAATALSKVTWFLAAAFITTSLLLTVVAAKNAGSRSVLDSATIESDGGDIPAAEGIDDDLKALIAPLPAADPAPDPAAEADPETPPAAN